MSKIDRKKIKLEKSDEKGMLNGKAMQKFLFKATKAVCEIQIPKGGFGSGFFCKIPYTTNNNNFLPVLLTNNHVLSREALNPNNYIKITIDGETKDISLKQRKIWTDEKIDFSCIEIKKEDNINSFFYLDDSILDNNDSNDCYLNQKVLIFGINKNDMELGYSNGIIKKNQSWIFAYTCNTYPGCSGGCIVNQINNGVIGIHRGEYANDNEGKTLNIGIYIRNVIKFIKDSKEINLSSKVNQYLII